jgi:hypothetical protein
MFCVEVAQQIYNYNKHFFLSIDIYHLSPTQNILFKLVENGSRPSQLTNVANLLLSCKLTMCHLRLIFILGQPLEYPKLTRSSENTTPSTLGLLVNISMLA